MTWIIDASLAERMKSCEQMPGLSVLSHGMLVEKRYFDLVGHIRNGSPLQLVWQLPDWITSREIIPRLLDDDLMSRYIVHHDCGKPFCVITDENGRRHFPDHAEVSRTVWLSCGGDSKAAALIAMDMDIHLLKDVHVEEFASRPQAIALLLTGLSEVHANAEMFGGIGSTGFKIKWKQIDKRGRAILKRIPALIGEPSRSPDRCTDFRDRR